MNIAPLLQHRYAIPVGVGVSAFVAGAGLGFVLGRRSPAEAEPDLHEQVIQVVTPGVPPKEDLKEMAGHILAAEEQGIDWHYDWSNSNHVDFYSDYELDGDAELDVAEEEALHGDVITSVEFAGAESTTHWDYEAERSSRDPKVPYTIHQDEFINDEMAYEQSTITYYDADQVMADEYDTPMYDHQRILGGLNWGHGANDVNTVYIRNETLELEWEVLRHTGAFQEEVLGLSPEPDYPE